MDYAVALTRFAGSELPRCFKRSGPRLQFVRPRRVAVIRATSVLLTSVVMFTWAWSIDSGSLLGLESVAGAVLLVYAVVLFRRVASGDVLATLDRAGLHVAGTIIPWHTIQATRITEEGALHLSIDGVDGDDRFLDFANADLRALQDAIETIAFPEA